MATILRAVAGLVLGMVVFAGLLYLLVVVNFSQRLEDSEVYRDSIEDVDAYNRVYDEVLVDEALDDYTDDLLGGVEVEVQEEAVAVLRDVMPPAYLREQTEDNIDRLTEFLRHEQDRLELIVDLSEPLERVAPAVQDRVDRVIEDLEVREPASSGCSVASLQALAAESAAPMAQMSDGQLPSSAPSLNILTRECRDQEFDYWFDIVLDNPAINAQAAIILEQERASLRQAFVEGDTREFLRQASAPLISPLTESAVVEIRREVQRNDRLDLLEKLVENSDDLSRMDIDEQAENLRDAVSQANGSGRVIALVMVIVGGVLLAAVHIPRPADVLRWPGITLLSGGAACLVVGLVINSAVPGIVRDAITRSVSYSADVPVAAIDLAGDLLESFARQATAGFIPAAVTVMAVGAVLIVASFFAGALWSVVSRIYPRSGNGDRSS